MLYHLITVILLLICVCNMLRLHFLCIRILKSDDFCMVIETLDFKFLLKPKHGNVPCVVEEGPNRQLIGGTLQGDQDSAMFKLSGDEILEYKVFIKADRVSPFDLAASWRAYQENFQRSTVRGIPDVSIASATEAANEVGIERLVLMRALSSFSLVMP